MIAFVDILYIVIAVAIVVIAVALVWVSNELIGLIKTVRRSSQNSEQVTKEIKEKVMLISESLDRAGSAASSLVGLMEDAVEGIKPRREKIADSLGLISGAGDHARNRQAKESEVEVKKQPVESKEKDKEEKEKNKVAEKENNDRKPISDEKKTDEKEQVT